MLRKDFIERARLLRYRKARNLITMSMFVTFQDSSPPSSGFSSNITKNALFVAIIAVCVTVLILVGFHLYALFVWWNRPGANGSSLWGSRRHRSYLGIQFPIWNLFSHGEWTNGSSPPYDGNDGLDQSVVDRLPTFVFNSATSSLRTHVNCSVCLEDFEDGQQGRLLPKCRHGFHVECIDMWFHSHSNCPVCRCDVNPHTLEAFLDAASNGPVTPPLRVLGSNEVLPTYFSSRLPSSPCTVHRSGSISPGKTLVYDMGAPDSSRQGESGDCCDGSPIGDKPEQESPSTSKSPSKDKLNICIEINVAIPYEQDQALLPTEVSAGERVEANSARLSTLYFPHGPLAKYRQGDDPTTQSPKIQEYIYSQAGPVEKVVHGPEEDGAEPKSYAGHFCE